MRDYPWYDLVTGDSLAQGDILEACRVFLPPANIDLPEPSGASIGFEERDAIVMTQSCDLEHANVTEVVLCLIWYSRELQTGPFKNPAQGLEHVRLGRLNGFHLLNKCDIADHVRPFRVVDFRRTFSLPLDYVKGFARKESPRLRLLPPYREHLSQAFARFFMRVGLPTDIPSFTK